MFRVTIGRIVMFNNKRPRVDTPPPTPIERDNKLLIFSAKKPCSPRLLSRIIETQKISDVLEHVCNQTLVASDVDETLMKLSQTLGGDKWFEHYICTQKAIHGDFHKALSETLEIYVPVQKRSKVKPVEKHTKIVIDELHAKAHTLLALTARGNELREATLEQLDSIGVSFNRGMNKNRSVPLTLSDTSHAHHGIVFCAGKNKGACLKEYIAHLNLRPKRIVFVDDKLSHVLAVKTMAEELAMEFVGFHYTLTHTGPEIDLEIIKTQLDAFNNGKGELLSDEEAQAVITGEKVKRTWTPGIS